MYGMPSTVQVITILTTYAITSTKLLSMTLARKITHRTEQCHQKHTYIINPN